MKEKIYVDRLFYEYEETQEINDFKEEIIVNLKERVKDFQDKGFSEDESFEKATLELGDITEIANQLGKQKRNEAISQMYIGSKVPLTKKHAAGYSICLGILLLGFIIAFINYTTTTELFISLGTLSIFVSIPCGILTFLGLTQETTRNMPMSYKRALFYGVTTSIIIFGLIISAMFFIMKLKLTTVLGVLITFIIPALIVLTFLILTEKKRSKPLVEKEAQYYSQYYSSENINPTRAAKFGILSAALWTFAIALFIVLGILISFKYSWMILLFLIPIQLLLVSWMFEIKK